MNQFPLVHLLMVIASLSSLTALGEVVFETKEGILTKFTIDSGRAELMMHRAVWRNSTLVTQGGEHVSVVDPFMYFCQVSIGGTEKGGYWSSHEVWDGWNVEQIQSVDLPASDIVKIVAEPPGWGVRKEVSISVQNNQSTAYVFNRLVATEDVTLKDDNQSVYVNTSVGNKFFVDGTEIRPEHGRHAEISRWIMVYYWNEYVSVGLIAMDRKLQHHPRPNLLGDITFSDSASEQGATISLRKGAGKMAKGDYRTQQYILLWGDGDLRTKMESISQQALAGELNENVYELRFEE